jgi:hypothetical protein
LPRDLLRNLFCRSLEKVVANDILVYGEILSRLCRDFSVCLPRPTEILPHLFPPLCRKYFSTFCRKIFREYYCEILPRIYHIFSGIFLGIYRVLTANLLCILMRISCVFTGNLPRILTQIYPVFTTNLPHISRIFDTYFDAYMPRILCIF